MATAVTDDDVKTTDETTVSMNVMTCESATLAVLGGHAGRFCTCFCSKQITKHQQQQHQRTDDDDDDDICRCT